jgi:hypothetical protein
MSKPVALDMDQALADFKELLELAALQFFDLVGLLRELGDAGTSILCVEIDSFSAEATDNCIERYKIAGPLLVCLAALRASQVHSQKIEGHSRDF